ncbi:MAG TPA: chemotaxis protein, partial [Rhodospirillales bacterium]
MSFVPWVSGFAWNAIAALGAAGAAAGAVWYVTAAAKAVKTSLDVCVRAAKGDFEVRITDLRDGGDIGALQHGINNMLDIADAFVRESGAAMEYVSRGKYFRKIMLRGLPGAFRHSAEVVNFAVEAMDRKVRDFNRFADGL